MRVYISGTSGFIASHLIKFFKEKKYEVVSVNRQYSKIIDGPEVITYENFINADLNIDKNKNFFIHTAWHGVCLSQSSEVSLFLLSLRYLGLFIFCEKSIS